MFTLPNLVDVARRALWTFLYVFVAALLVQAQTLTDASALSGAVAKAAVIAAVLAAVKTVITGRFGDPLAIRTSLSDLGVRLMHTAWQSLVAVLLAGGLSGFNRASVYTVLVAVVLNAIKGVALPSSPPAPAATNIYIGKHEGGAVVTPMTFLPSVAAPSVVVDPTVNAPATPVIAPEPVSTPAPTLAT